MAEKPFLLVALLVAFAPHAEADEQWYQCNASADCVLVQDSTCRLMESVNKDSLKVWEEKDNKPVLNSRSCSPLPYPAKMEDYKAECVHSTCQAIRITPWANPN